MENTSQPMDHLKQFSDYYARFAEMLVKAEEINKIFGRTVVIENAINQFDKSGESLNVLLKEYFPSHTLPDNLKKKLGLDDVEKVIKQILSIPIYQGMDREHIQKTINLLNNY